MSARWVQVVDSVLRGVALDPNDLLPGSVLWRKYKGEWLRVTVASGGSRPGKTFLFQGQSFPTLTAVARHITDDPNLSGARFFGLRRRPRTR